MGSTADAQNDFTRDSYEAKQETHGRQQSQEFMRAASISLESVGVPPM